MFEQKSDTQLRKKSLQLIKASLFSFHLSVILLLIQQLQAHIHYQSHLTKKNISIIILNRVKAALFKFLAGSVRVEAYLPGKSVQIVSFDCQIFYTGIESQARGGEFGIFFIL